MQPVDQFAELAMPYVVGGLTVGVLLLLALQFQTRAQLSAVRDHYRRLVRGQVGADLEQVLERHMEQLETLESDVETLRGDQRRLEVRLRRAVQNVGLVRYNPFQDTGGDQSFSVALLDGEGDGVVVTSLYSRTGTRTFAKPITDGESKYALTDEERQAIALARETASPMQS